MNDAMNGRLKGYAVNFLFALNIFVLFLLLFENKLMVPAWLEPIGRMHLLLLHFPIVLLILAMLLEVFRFATPYNTLGFYLNFTSGLLLAGVVFSGITVIMGLFLSREGDYGQATLSWHKWSGVTVLFIGSLMYTVRDSPRYKGWAAKTGAIITISCLLLTGHFGATLTHGENFIWQQLFAKNPVVPLEEATVFDHVIKPIFENKCIDCHNANKLKGRLILADSASVMKGGKNGKFVVAGNPEISLLLKRIHLPVEEKKHMPPSGNAQLTPDEMQLLYLWIKSGLRFNQKVTALPIGDSLRLQATAFLRSQDSVDELFDFSSADEQTVKMLNTNYRVVSPLAQDSPALTVSIFNSETYSSQTLDELVAIKRQIVSLELSKLPVKDTDLKQIARFENLRRLNLNFTEITGKGLQLLVPLEHLRSLSLAGTKVNYQDLDKYVAGFKNLNTVALWNTALTASEVQQLQMKHNSIRFLGGFRDDGSDPIKLNPPRIRNKSVVFSDSVLLELFHPVKGVDIRFTTDGSNPDSLTTPLFKGETVLTESTTLKARAYKSGWLSSDVVSLNLYKSSNQPDSIILLSRLDRVHPADGAHTFFDHQLGTFNANSPAWANNWAGVIKNDMALSIAFKTPRTITSVAINTLIETETYIFPPESIEIWGGDAEDRMRLISRIRPELPRAYSKPFIKLIDSTFDPQHIAYLKIIAKPVMKLPDWHKRKDQPALLLIDEIFIN